MSLKKGISSPNKDAKSSPKLSILNFASVTRSDGGMDSVREALHGLGLIWPEYCNMLKLLL